MATKEPIRKITLKSGQVRYQLVVDIGDDPVTGKRRQLTGRFTTRTEAKNKLAEIRHTRNTGEFIRPAKTTVAEYLADWLEGHVRDLEAATEVSYFNALRPARERLGRLELQALEKADVERMVTWMMTEGRSKGGAPGTPLGPRSVGITLTILSMALDVAVAERKIAYNPARLVKRPKQTQTPRVPWTVEEVKTFLGAIKDDPLYPVMFLSLMGLRPEEVCGLKWPKVDLEARTVTIDWARTMVKGKPVEKAPKTEAGVRPLPLPAIPWAALKRLKAQQAADKLMAGEGYGTGGYVLCDDFGQPWLTERLRESFYRLVKRADVRKVRLYDARHACLTYLATSGVPDVVVSAWAGHADLSFTKRRYVHPNAEHLAAGRDALDALFGS